MASSGKQRTTFAKLNREAKLLRRREEKAARKAARRLAAARESDRDSVTGSEASAEDSEDADPPRHEGDASEAPMRERGQ